MRNIQKRLGYLSILVCSLIVPQALAVDGKIYEVEVQTDSNWTSIEIRDEAEWVNAPDEQHIEIAGKNGIRNFTLSKKKMHLRPKGRGEINMKLYVQSPNNVLGLMICKGSPSSYTWIRSEQSRQKNDVGEKDHCEQMALVLKLY